MLGAQGLASFPANKARITIDINGAPHPATHVHGEEQIANGFYFVVGVLVDRFTSLSSYVGANTQLQFTGQDGVTRTVVGVVTKINELGWKNDRTLRAELTVESSLARLKHQIDTRIVLGHSVPDLLRQTCERNGLNTRQLHFDLSRSYPIKPYIMQANESDWDFLCRLSANAGIYFYSIVKNDQEVIVFTDHNAHCPYIAREVLHYIEPSAANKETAGNALVGIHQLAASVRQVIPQARIHDTNEDTPATTLLANSVIQPVTASQTSPQPGQTLFGSGCRTLDESDLQARRIAENAGAQAFTLTSKANVVDLAAGHLCSVEATNFHAQYNGDYFITSVRHESSQFAGQDDNDPDIAYRATATCIKRETPYRSATLKHPDLPMTLTARIESDGPYARLDEQGKYQIRALFDLSTTEHTQASIPLRRLSPYGGPASESSVGLHTPLHDGDEVLISCLNGDPDRPMIVGTLPNPERRSPVTSANPSVNRLRTMSDNELTFDDTKEKEAITLRTYAGYNILHLDHAAVGHKIRLATEHGAMVTFAKKTIHRESGDSMTERVGNDRLVKVKNSSRTETQNAEIDHQARTDHRHTAYKNFRMESGQNTELQTGRHMILDVAENARLTIKGSSGLFATVQSNDVFIQSANKIDVQGQGGGDITFEQSGGGFKISSGGVVSFYGNKVFLGGSGGVSLNGKVNYSVPGPQPPGAVSTTAPIAFAGIDLLFDESKEHQLKSTLAYDQLKGLVKFMSEMQFLTWMPSLFGFDLPPSAYKALRTDLLSGVDLTPEIVVVNGQISGTSAVYDKRSKSIYISETAIENAISDKDASWKLHIMLTEEFGHHVDNLLRTKYSDTGGDAVFDEGARYAFALINYKFDLQNILVFADYTGTLGANTLKVSYPHASTAKKKYLSVSHRYDNDSELTIEKFGDGRGKGHLSFGHQSIEDVLEEATFNDMDRLQIYFGNWLRDYSQACDAKIIRAPGAPAISIDVDVWDVFTGNGRAKFVNELKREAAHGLFSRDAITKVIQIMAQGEFIDSHLDTETLNKQKKIFKVDQERLGVYRPEEHIDNPMGIGDARHKDPDFRGAVKAVELDIDPNTGMKKYIMTPGNGQYISAIEYIEHEIGLAVQHGKTPEGMRHFGAALHTLEDFFAHSNFVELSINKLLRQGKLDIKHPGDRPVKQVVAWAPADSKTGVSPLVTGKFGGLDTAASILLKVGAGMAAADVCTAGERTPATHIAIILLKDIDKKQGDSLDSMLTQYEDWQKENKALATAMCRMTSFLFGWISEVIGEAVLMMAEQIDDIQSAYLEDPQSSNPTHSQLAKDHHGHHFHAIAAKLAIEAVKFVGIKMQNAWETNGTVTEILNEIKLFMIHPEKSDWMDKIVLDWSYKNQANVIRATDKGYLAEHAKEHQEHIKHEARKLAGHAEDVKNYYDKLNEKPH